MEHVTDRSKALLEQLLLLWEGSVRATHHFLTEKAIVQLKPQVLEALHDIERLIICRDESGALSAFMGVEGDKLEMLFVASQSRGGGIGKTLITYATQKLGVRRVDVNEQNPQAVGFYERFGFQTVKRSKLDGQGNPYPILHMERGRAEEIQMKRKALRIDGIPAILWGPPSSKLMIAVHGDLSHKQDAVIEILAVEAVAQGFQVLSFDLPEHGDRKQEPELCKVQICVEELEKILRYARGLATDISLFGCSIGAYFGMMAYRDEALRRALFLSPVVDMERLIQRMMSWFDVSEDRLEQEGEIETPAKTLYWDYYCYVREHPIRWAVPTAILYGSDDNLCEPEVVSAFAERSGADMTILENGEHFFHTAEQLAFFRGWLQKQLAI